MLKLRALLSGVFGVAVIGSLGAGQTPQRNFGEPMPGLTATELARFNLGKTQFDTDETMASGLGPCFNDLSCGACHAAPKTGGHNSISVTRFGREENGMFDPLANLGGSLLQDTAVVIPGYPDDYCQEVIPPQSNIMPDAVRITPGMFGAGLVEAIPDAPIIAFADPNDMNADGISGRVHMVQPLESPMGPMRVGRFGWKAQVATLLTFSGDAFLNENGITNRLVPTENAPNGDLARLAICDTVPEAPYEDHLIAPGVEKIDAFTDFQQLLGPPPQWPPAGTMAGETLFQTVGCANCHISTWTTGTSAAFRVLANQTIRPYSDFLLHDIGTGDHIVIGGATGKEFRTTLLWGLRQRTSLMHNGCVMLANGSTAADLAQTIMLHGCGPVIGMCAPDPGSQCEAQPSYNAYLALTAAQKTQLLDFLASLGRRTFDSGLSWPGDLDINLGDWFFMNLCLDNGGPNRNPEVVNPGIPQLHDCRLGFDSDLDGDTDLSDAADFQNFFNR